MRSNQASDLWRGTYLIQALNKPQKREGVLKVNPFSFGGGGSGLTKDALEMLSDLWDPEYMGAAEYEFGAFRDALNMIIEFRRDNRLVAVPMVVKGHEAEKLNERSSWYTEGQKIRESVVYVIANKNHLNDIQKVIQSLLTHDKIVDRHGYESPVRLKCGIRLWNALFDPSWYWQDKGHHNFGGGLELDNGWFVFSDEEMFTKVCKFFEVEFPAAEVAKAKAHLYVPPKVMFGNDEVDHRIAKALGVGTRLLFPEIASIVYTLNYGVGDVVCPEHIPLVEQVQRRLATLVRRKAIIRDPKTKFYTRNIPCPSPS